MSDRIAQSFTNNPYDLSNVRFLQLTSQPLLNTPETNPLWNQSQSQNLLNAGYGSQIAYNALRFGLRHTNQGYLPATSGFSFSTKLWLANKNNVNYDFRNLPQDFVDSHFLTQSVLNVIDMGLNSAVHFRDRDDLSLINNSLLVRSSRSLLEGWNGAGPDEALLYTVDLTMDALDNRAHAFQTVGALEYTGDSLQTNTMMFTEGFLGSLLTNRKAAAYARLRTSPYINFTPTTGSEADLLQTYTNMMGCPADDSVCADDAAALIDTLRSPSSLDEYLLAVRDYKNTYDLTDEDLHEMKTLVIATDSANPDGGLPNIGLGTLHQSALAMARMQNARAQFGYTLMMHTALDNRYGDSLRTVDHLILGASVSVTNQLSNFLTPKITIQPLAENQSLSPAPFLLDLVSQATAVANVAVAGDDIRLRKASALAAFDIYYSLFAPSIFHPLIYGNHDFNHFNATPDGGITTIRGDSTLNGFLTAELMALGGMSAFTAAQATAFFLAGTANGDITYCYPLLLTGVNFLILTGTTVYETHIKPLPPSVAEFYTNEHNHDFSRKKRMWTAYRATVGADLFSAAVVYGLYSWSPKVQHIINNHELNLFEFFETHVVDKNLVAPENFSFNPNLSALAHGEFSGHFSYEIGTPHLPYEDTPFLSIEKSIWH